MVESAGEARFRAGRGLAMHSRDALVSELPAVSSAFAMEDDAPPGRGIDGAGWLLLAVGLGLALLTELLPFLRVLVGYFVVLVHEMGHAAAGWLFGHPSLPAFDFRYGGGVTTRQDQVLLLVLLVYGAFAALGWVFRSNRVSLAIVASAVVTYTALVFSRGSEVAILGMGHGAELLFATLFIHRGLSGSACHTAAERPLYVWIGFHIVLHDLRFAWELMTSPLQREIYGEAKGGGHWMDFSRLSEEFFHVPLEAIAAAFFVACLLPPLVAFAGRWLRPELLQLRERVGEVG